MRTMLFVMMLGLAALAVDAPKEWPTFATLKVGAKVYNDVKVTSVEPSGIRFTHTEGVARVGFAELSDEVKAMFPYDAVKAKAFDETADQQRDREQKAREKNVQAFREARVATGIISNAEVVSVLPFGVVVKDVTFTTKRDVRSVQLAVILRMTCQPGTKIMGGEAMPCGREKVGTTELECFTLDPVDYIRFRATGHARAVTR